LCDDWLAAEEGLRDHVKYDAFLSYSHADRTRLARAVQAELQRLRPARTRPDGIFRDTPSLACNPYVYSAFSQRVRSRAEWRALFGAMASSRWFVLLASPGAAESVSVNRECQYWLDTQTIDRLAVVTTRSEQRSDATRAQVTRAILPAALRHRMHELPVVVAVGADVDGRNARRDLRRSLRPAAAAIYDKAPLQIAWLDNGRAAGWRSGALHSAIDHRTFSFRSTKCR